MMDFCYIHPFSDGNGRTSRALLCAQLFNDGYFGCIIPKGDRRKYLAYFTPYFVEHISNPWLEYVAQRVERFLDEIHEYERSGKVPAFDEWDVIMVIVIIIVFLYHALYGASTYFHGSGTRRDLRRYHNNSWVVKTGNI